MCVCVCVCVFTIVLSSERNATRRSGPILLARLTLLRHQEESRRKSYLFAASDIKLGSVCERREKQFFIAGGIFWGF